MKTQIDMTELQNIPKNGYNVISTFSGCGGSSLGYKLAGYDVKCAVEFIPNAAETYRINFPSVQVIEKDIRQISGKDLMGVTKIEPFELDILDGSPPCCDFSINGKREQGWGKIKKYSSKEQRVDDLFFEYCRIVKDLMPKVFVAENTKGLTLGNAQTILNKIVETLSDIGYNVRYQVLDASNYECPQQRERLILIGVRKDLLINPSFPKPINKLITTKDAIEDLMECGTDLVNHSVRDEQIVKYFPPHCTNEDVIRIAKANNLKVFEQNFRRDRWNEPYYTIRQHHTRPYHPIKNRLMSIDEAKRLQTFPDDFKLIHSPTQNWERIGRAVPPNLMKHIAKNIEIEILNKIPKDYKMNVEKFQDILNSNTSKVLNGKHKLL